MTRFVKIKEKIKLSSEIKMVLSECMVFALGFFLMPVRFFFGIYPFGLALVSASKKYTLFAFAGCLLSVAFRMDFNMTYLISLIGILGLRIICSLIQKRDKESIILGKKPKSSVIDILFYENPQVRVVICGFVALCIGINSFILNGYNPYDAFVLVFFSIFSGMLTYCYSVSTPSYGRLDFGLAFSAYSFSVIYALSEIEVFGFNISIILTYGLVLYVSKYVSGAKAGALGLILGLCHGAIYAPVFGICGIVSGFLWKISPYFATMCSFTLSMGYGIYVSGYQALVFLAPELLGVSLIMYALLRFEVLPVPSFIKLPEKTIDSLMLERRSYESKATIHSLSSSLSDISKMLKEVSEKTKAPTKQDYNRLCLEVCEEHCYTCPKHEICWTKDMKTTEENIGKLSDSAFYESSVSSSCVNEKFLHRCPNIDSISEKINLKIKENLTQGVKNDKLELLSSDYELLSKMINSTEGEKEKEELFDNGLSDKLKRVSAKIGFVCNQIHVYGTRIKKITAFGVDVEKTKCTTSTLKAEFERAIGTKLSTPEFTLDGSYAIMQAKTVSTLYTNYFTASCVAKNEEINGDTLVCFDGAEDKKYMLLCDGMGSGNEARLTSLLSATFLEKLLSITNNKEVALSMLNSFIRARNQECSSSVDLFEVDLITGSGSFIKSGAAPSFIKRGDNVYKLQSKTMPVGIMKSLDAELLSFELKQGDICIMISDGIVSSDEDCDLLTTLIKNAPESTINELPRQIIEEFKRRNGHNDDMTVGVMQIH